MKKIILVLLIAILPHLSLAQSYPHIMFDAFTFGIDSSSTNSLKKFNLSNPSNIINVGSISGRNFVAADFGYVTIYGSELFAIDIPSLGNYNICSVDTTSNVNITTIGSGSISSGSIMGMTYDRSANKMFVLISGTPTKLDTIDFNTGNLVQVAQLQSGYNIQTISVNYVGSMFGIDIDSDNLLRIDKTTGAVNVVGALGFNADYGIWSDFDIVTGKMFLMTEGIATKNLFRVDTVSGNATFISTLTNGLSCFSISYPQNLMYVQPGTLIPLFLWGDVINSASYHMQVSVDPAFAAIIINETNLSVPQYHTLPGIFQLYYTYFWRVRAMSGPWSTVHFFTITGSSIIKTSTQVPTEAKLYNNYPNPFNPVTKIQFDTPKSALIKIIVYNTLGKEIAILVNEILNAGCYEASWYGTGYPSGVYFYKLISGEFSDVKKMVLIK